MASAAFETDWDLVNAKKFCLIDDVVLDYDNPFMLGVNNIVSKLDYRTGPCCIYRRSGILSLQTMADMDYSDELPALSWK